MQIKMTIWKACESVTAEFQDEYEALDVYKKLYKALKAGEDSDFADLELTIRGGVKDD